MTEETLPKIDPERINEIYAELGQMEVRLDPNPIEFGPRRFNNKIERVRSHLNRAEKIFLQISHDLHMYKRAYLSAKTEYALEKNDLLLTDPEVRMERSQREREAKADNLLRKFLDRMRDLELASYDLEQLMVVVTAKQRDLKNVQGQMRQQMKMIDQDIAMGSRWGNRAPGNNQDSSQASLGSDEVSSMLEDLDRAIGVDSDDVGESLPENVNREQAESFLESVSLEGDAERPKQGESASHVENESSAENFLEGLL